MDQVIIFDKSLQQRLQEYEEALSGYAVLPVSSIQKEWSYYLELTVDPAGWQAIWKIPRKTCEHLNIAFPSIVLVYVVSIDFAELNSLVKVLAVQDEIHIPEKHYVPIIQLWPTKKQDKTVVLNLHSTANSLDIVRFFYNHLFMPYDYEDDDEIDWKSQHLEQRLRLYYDMKNGVLPRVTGERLHSLFSEAKRLQTKQEELESLLEEQTHFDTEDIDLNDVKVQALMEVRLRMKDIKAEIEALENPLLRNAVIKRHKETSLASEDSGPNIWVIFDEGTVSEYLEFLPKIQILHPDEKLKFSHELSKILECTNPGNVFILKEGVHEVKTSGALEQGGTLKGISGPDKTTLKSRVDHVMLDFAGDVTLENVTIDALTPQIAIIVRSGNLTLRNCSLIGDGKSSTHQGIIVLKGASLNLVDCEISKFYTCVVGNSGSSIQMEHCDIHDCNLGLLVFDHCSVKAHKVTFGNCLNYGICFETEQKFTENGIKIGDFDILNIASNLQLEFISGKENVKGDAIINCKSSLTAVEDLFNQDSEFSDDEMIGGNTTVVENGFKGKEAEN